MRSRKFLFGTIFLFMFSLLMLIVFGDKGLVELMRMRAGHQALLVTNNQLTQENVQMYRTVDRLQNDPAFIENVARQELGMIRSDELIFKFKTDLPKR